ncbi:DIE2/ALG10 family-domain-containing protein [Xylariaceae sp. FL1019]|nr:DIE2/ALG10 family-domain-containing protein [Xylariaceae sp. FL1019]
MMSSLTPFTILSEMWQNAQVTPYYVYIVVVGIFLLKGKIAGSTAAATVVAVLGPFIISWLRLVNDNVHEPYLDEVFHVPQAQVYCEGRYYDWDDKITTPPGLYILTVLHNRLMSRSCTIRNIRAFNADVTFFIAVIALACRSSLEKTHSGQNGTAQRPSNHDIWSGVNIALFPVTMFFSGLYYTDPLSTAVVLLAYYQHLKGPSSGSFSYLHPLLVVALGIFALLNRQTNVFWVVGYLGGLEVVRSIKELKPKAVETPTFQNLSEQVHFYVKRYSLGDIHDPPVGLAYPVDIALCVISIAIAAVCNIPKILRATLLARGLILGAFSAFILWNGGVVLGDKSNHVATVHLAQMLYIWPLFAFFSAPLFIPKILSIVQTVYQALVTPQASKNEKSNPGSPPVQTASLQICNLIGSCHSLHRVLLTVVALVAMGLVVRFNTIIHPFTLADNRHYMFYVFRYSILRAWWIRYALVPIYVVCAWLCWAALQGSSTAADPPRSRWIQSPFSTGVQGFKNKKSSGSSKDLSAEKPAWGAETSAPTSTVLLLLLTTALSLITAPLVEPRYFILPWVFWRLLLPASSPWSRDGQRKIDPILMLESGWFLLINVTTMYVFLKKPFLWYAPDGTLLDEGRVQRFMW